MLIMAIIISLTMIVFGCLFMNHHPREINSITGYRSSMSSKNKDTWKFAHEYAGKVWFISGIITSVVSVVVCFVFKDNIKHSINTILEIFVLIMFLMVIPLTEIKLRKVFDKNGHRKRT